jgi:acetyl esterase/lipase
MSPCEEIMRILRVILPFLSLAGTVPAALKPIESDLHPVGDKAVVVYKTTPQGDLKMNLYFPPDWKNTDRRPAIVFFFGGSCATGSPAQFATTAEYFATRGLVAASAEYRIETVHHTPPQACPEDAKSAIRWLRMNARRLGIDVGRVIAGGGSSGGTIAAFAAYNTTFEPEGEDGSASSKPDALVLFNPALGFPDTDTSRLSPEQRQAAQGPIGALIANWKVTKGGPPAILFFGTEDPLQEKARDFARQLVAAGTRSEFYTAAGQEHGFFNRSPGSPWHALVLRQTDLFLASLGYLKGNPTVAIPANTTAALDRVPL